MSWIRAYAQLLRLPNVFTALADICLGWMAAQWYRASTQPDWVMDSILPGSKDQLPILFNLMIVSGCLYCAGMVWNDYFDVEEDRRERPFRPIPSGRVSRRAALVLGIVLLAGGIWLAASTRPFYTWCGTCAVAIEKQITWRPIHVAVPLVACILLYDAWLKRTWAGPLGMGACRLLNVLLGLSATGRFPEPWMWHIAGVVGVYIVGVTWFARTEAVVSRRGMLLAAAGVMVAAFLAAVVLPAWWSPSDRVEFFWYPYFLAVWGFVVGLPVAAAIRQPKPQQVQAAIKRCILGLIGLDALLAYAIVGWAGLTILVLLAPALLLGRWVYST
jgi:4-hydroxybenzoate polyprenyltransferase